MTKLIQWSMWLNFECQQRKSTAIRILYVVANVYIVFHSNGFNMVTFIAYSLASLLYWEENVLVNGQSTQYALIAMRFNAIIYHLHESFGVVYSPI